MGSIKTQDIKKIALQISQAHPDRITRDFGENKKLVDELQVKVSKSVRNRIAGSLSNIARKNA